MKRRNLILLLGGASSGAMSVGTGAFSSMEAERGVEVNVANDMNAYIRYETPSDGASVEYGEQVTLVRVRNQFGGNQDLALVGVEYEYEDRDDDVLQDIDVKRYDGSAAPDEELRDEDFTDVDADHVAVERGSANGNYPAANEDDAFGPGEWVRIAADAYVPPGESPDVEVTITIEGVEGGVSAQLFGDTRAFTITGEESSDPLDNVLGVKFPGESGNPKLKPDNGGSISARAYYEDGELAKTDFKTVEFGEPLKTKQDFEADKNHTIKGIEIEGTEKVFRRSDASNDEKLVTNPVDRETAFD